MLLAVIQCMSMHLMKLEPEYKVISFPGAAFHRLQYILQAMESWPGPEQQVTGSWAVPAWERGLISISPIAWDLITFICHQMVDLHVDAICSDNEMSLQLTRTITDHKI